MSVKDKAALHAATRDLKKQVERIDLKALVARVKKLEGRTGKLESNTHATDIWHQAISRDLEKATTILLRIDILLHGMPPASPPDVHPNEKPTPRER